MGVTNSQTINVPIPIEQCFSIVNASAQRLQWETIESIPDQYFVKWKSPGNVSLLPVVVTVEMKTSVPGETSILLGGEVLSWGVIDGNQNIPKTWKKLLEPLQTEINRRMQQEKQLNQNQPANSANSAAGSQQPNIKKAAVHRVNRSAWWKESWTYFLSTLFIGYAFSNGGSSNDVCVGLGLIFVIGSTVEYLIISSKRLHDLNRSGAFALIGLIPIVGWLILCIPLGFIKGTEGPNRYGEAPADKPNIPLPEKENTHVVENPSDNPEFAQESVSSDEDVPASSLSTPDLEAKTTECVPDLPVVNSEVKNMLVPEQAQTPPAAAGKKQNQRFWVVGGLGMLGFLCVAAIVGRVLLFKGSASALPGAGSISQMGGVSDATLTSTPPPSTATPQPTIEGFRLYRGVDMTIMLPVNFIGGDPKTGWDELLAQVYKVGTLKPDGMTFFEQVRDNANFYAFDPNQGILTYPVDVVIYKDTQASGSVQFILQDLSDQLKNQCATCSKDPVQYLTINGYEGGKIRVTYLNGDPSSTQLIYVLKAQENYWVVKFSAYLLNFDHYLPLFEKSIQTFTVYSGGTPMPQAAAESFVPYSTPTAIPTPTLDPTSLADQPDLVTEEGKGYSYSVLVYSPDGYTVAAGSWKNHMVEVMTTNFAYSSQDQEFIGHTGDIYSLAFSPDGKILASGSADQTLRLWRVADGTLLQTLTGFQSGVTDLAFTPDGQTVIAACDDGVIRFFQVQTGSLLKSFDAQSKSVKSIALSPDQETLATGSGDGPIRLWNLADGKLLGSLEGHTDTVYDLAYSPDGKILASSSADTTIRLWEAKDSKLLSTLTDHKDIVSKLSFSPDGKLLASASSDRTVKLWRIPEATLYKTIYGFNDIVTDLDFSPNGKYLATSSFDGFIRVWGKW